jgi:HEAT repeat protein
LPAAIAGLGEVGGSEDLPLIEPYLRASPAKMRAMATRAFGALADDREVSTLLQLLQDESKRVCREATIALKKRLEFALIAELWSIFQTNTRIHVRRAVVELLEEVDIWRAMPYFVVASADDEVRIAAYVQKRVLSRMNGVYTKPTAEQRRAIQEKLDLVAVRAPVFVGECRMWLSARC